MILEIILENLIRVRCCNCFDEKVCYKILLATETFYVCQDCSGWFIRKMIKKERNKILKGKLI